ncbi:MAG TPA: hypothetical protein VFI61_04270 [Patescibacteria group bacterium]|nr:hypothetical protein [Patescibacteria group bacterium]
MTIEYNNPIETFENRNDPIETLRTRKNTEFELFLYLHKSCRGFRQSGNKASCGTHGVSAIGNPLRIDNKGYFKKLKDLFNSFIKS